MRVLNSFLSHSEGDFYDEVYDLFEEDRDEGELAEDSSSSQPSDSGFVKDLQIQNCLDRRSILGNVTLFVPAMDKGLGVAIE